MVVAGREKQEENDRHAVSETLSNGPSFPSEDLAIILLGRTSQTLWQCQPPDQAGSSPLSSCRKKGTYLLQTNSCVQCT